MMSIVVMPKFCANLSLLFTEYPLIERFAYAKQMGFEAVEIQFPYELRIADIKQQLNQHQLKLVLINVPAGDLMQGGNGLACVPHQEQAFRMAVLQALNYAHELDVNCVNVLAGRQPQDVDLLDCLRTLAANLRYAAEAFQSIGVTTTLEAINTLDMPRFLIKSVVDMQEMLEVVDHPTLKMQFDCYHMARMGEDIIDSLTQYIADIAHIQFADIPNRHQPLTGELDFNLIFNTLDALAYKGYCGAEYRPLGHSVDSFGWFERYRR